MENKDLILKLIQQDLKHNQLTEKLRQIGFDDSGLYDLDILSMVVELMNHSNLHERDAWIECYLHSMSQAHLYPVSHKGDELRAFAENCYSQLKELST